MEFDNQYLGYFPLDNSLFIDLAKEYHMRTENYDRTVCTGPIVNGYIRPSNGKEMAMINRNAHMVLKDVTGRYPGQESRIMKAISAYRDYK